MSVSVSPCHLSGSGRTALASSSSAVDLDRELALAGGHHRAVDADPVAEVERLDVVERVVADHGLRHEQLDLAAAVAHRREHQLAVSRQQHHAAGDVDLVGRSRCPARVPPTSSRTSASVCERSKRYGYGSVPASRSSSTCARRRDRSALSPLLDAVTGSTAGSTSGAVRASRRLASRLRPHRLQRRFPGPRWLDGSRCPRIPAMASSLQNRAVVVTPPHPLPTPGGRPLDRRRPGHRRGGRCRRAAVDQAPATPGAAATAVEVLGDIVTVSDVGELDTANLYGSLAAARDAGGVGTAGRSVTIGMTRITRAGSIVQQAPSGFRFPMSVTALHPSAIAGGHGPRDLGRARTDHGRDGRANRPASAAPRRAT